MIDTPPARDSWPDRIGNVLAAIIVVMGFFASVYGQMELSVPFAPSMILVAFLAYGVRYLITGRR